MFATNKIVRGKGAAANSGASILQANVARADEQKFGFQLCT